MSTPHGSLRAPPLYALVDTAAPPQAPVVLPLSAAPADYQYQHQQHAQPYTHTPHQNQAKSQNPNPSQVQIQEPPHSTHGHSSSGHQPSHHSPAAQRQFEYKMDSRGAVAVLTLSGAAAYSRSLATVLGREPITGSVRLHLERPTVVKAITVSISGRCKPKDRAGADNIFDEDTTFLDISHTVWAAHDPKDKRGILGPPGSSHSVDRHGMHRSNSNSNSSPYGSGGGRAAAPDGKLQGDYHWTFAIDLPSAVVAPSTTGAVAYAALQKLRDGYYASAVFSVAVRIQREWSAPDYKIKASFSYIPVVWPPPLPVPGPLPPAGKAVAPAAHERWHPLAPVRIMGTLARRPFEVACTLFLAKPLNYTRGSLIPLCMRLSSVSSAALDALATPHAPIVRLRRRGALAAVSQRRGGAGALSVRLPLPLLGGDAEPPSEVGLATWGAARAEKGDEDGGEGIEHVRYLAGELVVERALKPSSTKIEYSVVLYRFSAPDIDFAGGERDAVLREQLVDIDETIC